MAMKGVNQSKVNGSYWALEASEFEGLSQCHQGKRLFDGKLPIVGRQLPWHFIPLSSSSDNYCEGGGVDAITNMVGAAVEYNENFAHVLETPDATWSLQ
jgi:hypothetical protein